MEPVSSKPKRIALISFPWTSNVPYKFISDIIRILIPISDNIYVISGNINRIEKCSDKVEILDIGLSIHLLNNIRPKILSLIIWVIKCLIIQIMTCIFIYKRRNLFEIIVFYMAYPYFLFPLIIAKLLGKKTIDVVTRSKPNNKSMLTRIILIQDRIIYRLIDGITPESASLINNLNLDKLNINILPESARYVDTHKYTSHIAVNERQNIIGFIGRHKKEKGIIEFLEAAKLITTIRNDVLFLVGGNGEMYEYVIEKGKQIRESNNAIINIVGFIDNNEMPKYLNKLKILVLPTVHNEGLPTIILEAMACGVIVLSTGVGAISDLIIDEQTGFILNDVHPDCIAEKIIYVLEHKELHIIASNARLKIEEKYTYSEAVKRWKNIVERIYGL